MFPPAFFKEKSDYGCSGDFATKNLLQALIHFDGADIKEAFCGIHITDKNWKLARLGVKARVDLRYERNALVRTLVIHEAQDDEEKSIFNQVISQIKVSTRSNYIIIQINQCQSIQMYQL